VCESVRERERERETGGAFFLCQVSVTCDDCSASK